MSELWWVMIKPARNDQDSSARNVSIRAGEGQWIADVGRNHDTEAIECAVHIVELHNASLEKK